MSSPRVIARMMALLAIAIIGCQSIVGIEKREYDPGPPAIVASAQCKKYCDDLKRVCKGTDVAFSTLDACLATCALLPPGDPGEPEDGNTVECRQRQIALAEIGETALNCPRAGPGGDGVCGTNCESYCYLFNAACSALVTPLANCKAACSVLRDNKSFDVIRDHDGDTLQCRLVHVSNSAWNPSEHCPHARIVPVTHPCDNPQDKPPKCEDYCRINSGTCSGAQAVYESVDQCMSVCAVLPQGLEADTAIDTVGCRKYHSYNSVGDPVTHCPHSGPGGDGHCGTDNCPAYCTIVSKACGPEFATTFGGVDNCLTECRKIKGSAANSGYTTGAANGNTLQCRMLHAVRGFADPMGSCASAVGGADCQ